VRLVAFSAKGMAPTHGAVTDAGVVDLGKRFPDFPTIASLLEAGVPTEVREAIDSAPDYGLDEVRLLPPHQGAQKILCVGINYPERNAEYDDPRPQPKYPNLFVRFPSSFVGHNDAIVRPAASEQLDYEGEIVLVIGTEGRNIKPEGALEHIGGITVGNEGTVRDWVEHGTKNVTQGKNFDRSGSIGPWVVPAFELSLDRPFTVETRVNEEVRQHDTSDRLTWGFAALISYISTFTTLRAGDLIFTGTPTGSGSHHKPPVWLVPGDVVEVEVSGIGLLKNTVVDER
jgi:2-keto-4-pentenoate hydratase/2-oxohepta-3-ene-1,7-dioic acid hydratase in catechol pathway